MSFNQSFLVELSFISMLSPWGGRSQRRCANLEKKAKFSCHPFEDMTKITEFLDTVIARLRRCEKCCNEADVKWGKWNQGKPKQSRHEDHQSITGFVAFTVCCHHFCNQYFIICVVFTVVARQCTTDLLSMVHTQHLACLTSSIINGENQFDVVVVVVVTSYPSHRGEMQN